MVEDLGATECNKAEMILTRAMVDLSLPYEQQAGSIGFHPSIYYILHQSYRLLTGRRTRELMASLRSRMLRGRLSSDCSDSCSGCCCVGGGGCGCSSSCSATSNWRRRPQIKPSAMILPAIWSNGPTIRFEQLGLNRKQNKTKN